VAGSLLTSLLVFGATPAALLTLVGNPLGQGLGHRWDHAGRLALAVVVVVAWVAWAACCSQLVRAVVAQVRQGHVNTPVGSLLSDRLAGRIAAGVLAVVAVAGPVALGAETGVGAAGAHASAVAVGNNGRHTAGPGAGSSSVSSVAGADATAPLTEVAPPPAPATTYVVHAGDSLWSIAAAQLDDGADWPAIAALNLGRTMPDGLRFVDPNRIEAGWTLQMPDVRPAALPLAALDDGLPPTITPIAPIAPITPIAPAPATAPAVSSGAAGARRSPLIGPGTFTVDSPRRQPDGTHAPTLEGAGPATMNLPELAALGFGAVACAALARRSRRARLLRHVLGDQAAEPTVSAAAIDTDILLARFDGVPALAAFEAANYGLGGDVHLALPGSNPAIRAICVSAAGVDFWLAEPGQAAPERCTLSEDGSVWHVDHDAFPSPGAGRPFLPIAFPIGEDTSGTWLVPVGPGRCLPLVGEAAEDLRRAAVAAQEAWSWSDLVLVTDDPRRAAAEVQSWSGSGAGAADAPEVLFVGSPDRLPDTVAQHVSVLAVGPGQASDVTVLVDQRAASIHPLGRTVRPHLMAAATSGLIAELVAAPEPTDPLDRTARPAGLVDTTSLAAPDPGTVEVRLLTPTPRLEGLSAALPPNRARRAVELVAYLAVHAGDEVTSDRLRTRVLGSADADAAAKTLFNIATAARRAMGTDAAGTPLFPPGTRTGHYRVAGGVTTDVHRAASLAFEGSRAESPGAAMALLRGALDLVEGEPMASALSGYSWWDSEGHGARIAAVLVNAANDLAALAVEAGLFDLAQWGLDQARLVDPYSEALSRAAMQVAAAAGDADRLRREWRECQRRIDELDPGSAPSPRTERLYDELARHILVGAGDP
jgi:hypothetical protein